MEEKLFRKAKEELINLVKIESPSGKESEILKYIEKRLKELGMDYEKQYIEENKDRYNIVVNPESDFVFCTHVDTIPVISKAYFKQNVVYGTGSADAKASIASIFLALESRDTKKAIAFTVDEEEFGIGSKVLAEKYRFKKGIVMEPTDLKICTAQAGSLEFEIKINGKEAHGSCIEYGENAIEKIINIINGFEKFSFLKEKHELVGFGGYNVEYIKGGAKVLLIPSSCEALIDFRVLPNQNIEDIEKMLTNYFKENDVEYKIVDVSKPFEIREDSDIVEGLKKSLKKFGIVPEISGFKSWTDASNLYEAGCEVLIFGPGKLEISHTSKEHVRIEDVIIASNIIADMF